MAAGEQNLQRLIKDMEPVLNKGIYVFANAHKDHSIPRHHIICQMEENEGTTLILAEEHAKTWNLFYEYTCAWITLNVHSSLHAVGLTAAVARALAKENISCNVVAGYYHDHIFVYKQDASKALQVLQSLSLKKTETMSENKIENLIKDADNISQHRKKELETLAKLIADQKGQLGYSIVNFVCTHNSRRSQLAQIWFWKALAYYDKSGIASYSAGTESTAFNLRMVEALQRYGFNITALDQTDNPRYVARDGAAGEREMVMFSKTLSDNFNPDANFIAVMVCDQADHDCPFVPGASQRFSLPFTDPKHADGKPNEKEVYDKKVLEIGKEILYLTKSIE